VLCSDDCTFALSGPRTAQNRRSCLRLQGRSSFKLWSGVRRGHWTKLRPRTDSTMSLRAILTRVQAVHAVWNHCMHTAYAVALRRRP
jgi:hypothetical protein